MKKCSSFSQNRKLVVIIVRGAFFIVEEVLSNCRSTGMVRLKSITIWLSLISYCFWYVLFYSILQSLGCAGYVPTITAVHVLINDHTLLLGWHDIFADRWKHLSCGKHYTKFYCTKTRADSGFALIFKFCGDIANPR